MLRKFRFCPTYLLACLPEDGKRYGAETQCCAWSSRREAKSRCRVILSVNVLSSKSFRMVDYLESRRNTLNALRGESRVFCTMKKRIYKALLSRGSIYIFQKNNFFSRTNLAVHRLVFPTAKNLVNPANSVTKAEAPRI